MRKFSILLTGVLFSVLTFAQTLNLDVPVTLTNGAFGETVENANSGYNIISRDASRIFATPATPTGSNYTLGTATSFFPNSADYSIYYRTPGGSPDFYKTGASGTAPNRNITLDGATASGSSTFNITPNTPQDDYGVRTIGTTDGILTAALRKTTNSDLYQIVLIKTNPTGTIQWQTSIPTSQTGYDDTFTGQDANGNFTTEITPEPFVKQIKEVADGYLVVNMSRRYFPPGTSNIFATFIKLDFAGNILWTNTQTIPTRSIGVGTTPSSEGNSLYFVGDVTGFEDGNTYIPFAGGGDLRPYAQVSILDNTGTLITNYSTTYIVLDDASFQIKKFNNRIYWLRRTETFPENSAPIFTNDFSIIDITDGFNLTDPAVVLLPPTPTEFFVPNDMQLTPEGNFLVTGSKYPSTSVNGNNPDPNDAEPFAIILEANIPTGGAADLALSVEAADNSVGIYDYVELTYTVTNEGSSNVTGITAAIRRTTSSVLAGDFPADASQGIVNNGFSENASWDVGSLNAGQSATLTVTYFTLSASTSFCGEITAMSESDTDSSPNNATCENPQEDDEVYIEIGQQAGTISGTVFLDNNRDGGENCTSNGCTFIPGIEIKLYLQNTNALVGTAVSQANGVYLFPNVPAGQYTLEYEYQNNLVPTPYLNGPFNFEFTNNFLDIAGETPYIGVTVNNSNLDNIFNLGLVDGTECTLEELFVETICDNKGTPNNPNDDTFEVNFRADGEGRAAFSLNGGSGPLWNNSITYSDGFELIGPFNISELPVTLTLNNLANLPGTPCSLSETITSVDCGSTGGNQPDLTITTTGNIPASMQPGQNYPSAANITNSGTAAASGTQFNNIIYLSTDANLDASDISLSVVGLNFLEAGATNAFLNIFIPANTTLGEYFILYVVDNSNTIDESNENNNILARPVTIGPIGTGGVDLELTASADAPTIYQNGEAVFTLTNTGSQTATNIEVLFAKNSSLNITGTPVVSQGTSAVHWTAAPEWSVGSLAAGQSASITFVIFSLSDTPTLYGQVVFQSEADADSSPDNGNGSTAVEDDEAVYPGGGSSGGEGLQVNCNTTTNPPSPIFVNPDININQAEVHWDIPTATTDCPGGIVNIEQINGPTQQGFFSPVGNGYTVVYEITDECGNSETCIIPFFVNGFAGELVCPDDITVTATSPAGAIVTFADAVPFTGCDANPTGPFEGEPMSGDLFPIGTTEIRFAEFFSGSPTFCQNLENCYLNITVLPEGGGGDGVDLELTASADAPTIYQNGTAVFTITNNGNETATGVELEFHKNSTVNIISTPVTTQGTSQVHWTEVPRWNVGNLAAGQSASITYSIFSLSNDINFYGQVTAQNENDADSTPNNGNGTTPNEDDEASYPGGGSTGGGNQADLTLANLNITGSGGAGDVVDYTVLVRNIGTATAAGSYVIGAYLSIDNQLSGNDVQVGVINTGNTPVGTEPLTTGAITVPSGQTPGNYFLILETDTNGNIAESNENNNVIATSITVSGGNTSNGIDLSLNINAPATIAQYQNFTAEYVVTNNGTTAATNVSIDVLPAFNSTGIVYQGGNEASVSQGNFNIVLSTVWTVGSIPAGGSATLTANLFSLASSSNTLWGEVLSFNGTDTDSTPGNGVYGQSNEDDEATFTVNITNNLQGGSMTNSLRQVSELSAKLYPVPTRNDLTIDVFTENTAVTQLFIRDTNGKVLTTRNLAAQKGVQTVQIHTENWANGVYFLQLVNKEEMKNYRFLKQ